MYGRVYTYNDTHVGTWSSYDDVWVHGFFYKDWLDSREKIASVNTINKTITLETAPSNGLNKGQRYYYWNVLEELDTEGEYYIDRNTGILYFYPPSSIDSDSDAVVSILASSIFNLDSATNVKIEGRGSVLHPFFSRD